ncbi:hypothetical protein ACLKA7_005204 [Drosophila subpalustris]
MLLSTYADDTVIMCASDLPSTAVRENQVYLGHFAEWAKKWPISINAIKTGHVLYTLRNLDEASGQFHSWHNQQRYRYVTYLRSATSNSAIGRARLRTPRTGASTASSVRATTYDIHTTNPHLTQRPIAAQREASANNTHDSHETLLNHPRPG